MQNHKDKNQTKKVLSLILIACLLVTGIGGYQFVQAKIDETNAVHINPSEIENSTLIIGTHLIYLGAMTDEIYSIAMESKQQASQYNLYYKSELAEGVWFNITNASSLEDISTYGVPVSDDEIHALFMTHHTKSDGITYELKTESPVCIFDINNPYDLGELEELQPILTQYERLAQIPEDDLSDTDKRNMELLQELFTMDFTTEESRIYDNQLKALQTYYEILVRDDGDAQMISIVSKTMEKIDAARRTAVLEVLQNATLDALISCINRNREYQEKDLSEYQELLLAAEEQAETSEESESEETESEETDSATSDEGKKIEGFVIDNTLVSSVGEAMSLVMESYNQYSSMAIAEGSSVLSKAEYQSVNELVSAAESENYAECDVKAKELLYLEHINNSIVGDEEEELNYINRTLIPMIDSSYRKSVSSGVGEAYRALPSTAAEATKAVALKNQKNETEAVRVELQFILQAAFDRMTAEAATEFIVERLDESKIFEHPIKLDDYRKYALESVEAYVQWLTQKMQQLKENGNLATSEMQALQLEKEKLQEERKDALDKNDLEKAKRLEAEIEALDKMLKSLEDKLNAILNSRTASLAEKAAAAAALGDGSTTAKVQALRDSCVSSLNSKDYESVKEKLEALGTMAEMNPNGVFNVLQSMYEDLGQARLTNPNDASKIDDLITTVEDVTAEHIDSFNNNLSENDIGKLLEGFFAANDGVENIVGAGGGGAGGNASGAGGETSGLGSSESALTKALERMSASDQMAAVAGMSLYAKETGSETVLEALRAYVMKAMARGEHRIYEKLESEKSKEYVPLDKLASCIQYRYIFNDNKKQVVLQKGGTYYQFQVFHSEVLRQENTSDEMSMPAAFQTVVYIESDYVKKTFSYNGIYLEGCDYGILLSDEEWKLAEEFFDYLMEVEGV